MGHQIELATLTQLPKEEPLEGMIQMLQQQVTTEVSICLTNTVMHIEFGINIVGYVIPLLPQVLCTRCIKKFEFEKGSRDRNKK